MQRYVEFVTILITINCSSKQLQIVKITKSYFQLPCGTRQCDCQHSQQADEIARIKSLYAITRTIPIYKFTFLIREVCRSL